MTRLRITHADVPSRRIDRWTQDVDAKDGRALLDILRWRAAARRDWPASQRLAIEAYDERAGWRRYEQPR